VESGNLYCCYFQRDGKTIRQHQQLSRLSGGANSAKSTQTPSTAKNNKNVEFKKKFHLFRNLCD
jgi:hypothetical protein